MSIWDRLWTALRAIREYPALSAHLESAQSELRQAQQALKHSEQEYGFLNRQMEEQNYALKFHSQQSRAFQAALREFCPSLSSTEDMKRFYDTVSPILDAQGFTLYHMVEQMTGIDVSSFFPYEDNLGMFEEADGRQLLRWLTAAHFHAVDWTIVPGTCYEAATLREVDISTPEYQAFEKQLYEKVLERMGFQDFLTPKQEVNAIEKTTELKLYSPLRAELVEEPPVRDGIDEPEPPGSQFLTSDDLSAPAFRAAILQGIKDEQLREETERGLMLYYDGPSSVDEKVISFFPSVEEVDGRLYGVAVCQVKGHLTLDELEELKEYCTAQYADAWGEGYEQRPRKTEYGELYVSFWQDKGFFIQTKEELETVKAPARSRPQVRRDGGER